MLGFFVSSNHTLDGKFNSEGLPETIFLSSEPLIITDLSFFQSLLRVQLR